MLEAVAGTYTCLVYDSETAEGQPGDIFHREFMQGIKPAKQENTLVLNADGTYEYTKTFTGQRRVEGT